MNKNSKKNCVQSVLQIYNSNNELKCSLYKKNREQINVVQFSSYSARIHSFKNSLNFLNSLNWKYKPTKNCGRINRLHISVLTNKK